MHGSRCSRSRRSRGREPRGDGLGLRHRRRAHVAGPTVVGRTGPLVQSPSPSPVNSTYHPPGGSGELPPDQVTVAVRSRGVPMLLSVELCANSIPSVGVAAAAALRTQRGNRARAITARAMVTRTLSATGAERAHASRRWRIPRDDVRRHDPNLGEPHHLCRCQIAGEIGPDQGDKAARVADGHDFRAAVGAAAERAAQAGISSSSSSRWTNRPWTASSSSAPAPRAARRAPGLLLRDSWSSPPCRWTKSPWSPPRLRRPPRAGPRVQTYSGSGRRRCGHHPIGVRRCLALEPIGRVADLDPTGRGGARRPDRCAAGRRGSARAPASSCRRPRTDRTDLAGRRCSTRRCTRVR